jgi:hypothetical protein
MITKPSEKEAAKNIGWKLPKVNSPDPCTYNQAETIDKLRCTISPRVKIGRVKYSIVTHLG